MTAATLVQNDAETNDTQTEAAIPEGVLRVAELIASARARRLSDNPAETESA